MNIEERLNSLRNGQDSKLYDFLGSHLATKDGKSGAYFRAYSPNAKEIFVTGDFNNFDKYAHPLYRLGDSNVWEVFVEGAKEFDKYKFIIIDKFENELVKIDPFAFYSQNLDSDKDFATIIYNL